MSFLEDPPEEEFENEDFDEDDLPPGLDPEALEGDGAEKKEAAAVEEPEEEIAHPDTPVPTPKKMRAALDWAFEGEDSGEVTDELLDAFAEHAILMLEKNRVMNLTTILDPKEVAAKHFLDSWRILNRVPLMARSVLDLGSGAGFPGLPLALGEPNLSMTLVDSIQKKAGFLQECVEKLAVRNVKVVADRAEEHLARNRVDVVIVRAVSSVRENVRTLRKVRHSLKDLVMLKGSSWSREVRAAEREAERLGFKLDTVWEHELPDEMGARAILVYRAPGGHGL